MTKRKRLQWKIPGQIMTMSFDTAGRHLITGNSNSTVYVLRLEPDSGTYGRTGFLMHGDSEFHPGEASKGCIIMDRVTRTRVYQSGDTKLMVVPGVVVADPEITI